MTETEWLSCDDPGIMLAFVNRRASDRKSRLFAVGCCRRIWHMLTHEASRVHVEVAERFVDRSIGHEALNEQQKLAEDALWESGWSLPGAGCAAWLVKADREAAMAVVQDEVDPGAVAGAVAESLGWEAAAPQLADKDYAAWRATVEATRSEERGVQRDLVRCVFGNPFRPISVKPSWLSTRVIELSRAIYDERAFERLPELADALQAAGCEAREILDHCRERYPHARGCWALDSILGRM